LSAFDSTFLPWFSNENLLVGDDGVSNATVGSEVIVPYSASGAR
jgi:hypothetical protein